MISIIMMDVSITLLYFRHERQKEGDLSFTSDWLCCIFTAPRDHVTFYILEFPR